MKTKSIILALLLAVCCVAPTMATTITEPTPSTMTKAPENAEEKAMLTQLLNDMCVKRYGEMFTGRYYVENSLYITSYRKTSEGYYVEGTHNYIGRLGDSYNNYAFKATIKIISSSRVKVTFVKRSAPDFFHRDYYWETGECNINGI